MNGRKKTRHQGKAAKNLSLDPAVIAMGEELSTMDKREFSAEVSWLIEGEYRRRQMRKAS